MIERLKRFLVLHSPKQDNAARKKAAVVFVLFMVVFAALIGRVAWLQFVRGEELQKKAYNQQNSWRTIPAKRGTITDRNGTVLAISVTANQVNVNQQNIVAEGKKRAKTAISAAEKEKAAYIEAGNDMAASSVVIPTEASVVQSYQEEVAKGLSALLDLEYESVLAKVQSSGRYKEIVRKIDIELGQKVKDWISAGSIKGVYVDEDVKRYYPNNSLASHVLGFTGRDDQGLVCGVEVALDSLLAGRAGRIITEVDAAGNTLPYEEIQRLDPVDGYHAVLTIDATIQYMVEEALREAANKWGVKQGAACLVLDAKNADILAMASYPDFNLNDPYACPEGMDPLTWVGNTSESVQILSSTVWRNKTLTDTYEPGSTFKTITSAMGLEEGLITANTMVTDAPLSLAGWTIRCWRKSNIHGSETFAAAVRNSCNPVFANLSLKLGLDKFYQYVEAFGFRTKTGILLSGEATSIFHTAPTEIDMAVASFGQRFQITPIQLATAYCAIANGGTLYTPRIVKELVDNDGVVIRRYDSQTVRQVISKETSKELMDILESVVSIGTGSNAYVSGYRVAGKTGTSETQTTKVDGRYIASFCGVAPADDPEIVVLFILDHPTVGNASGGTQAAPSAGALIEKILSYMNVERRYTDKDRENMMEKYYVPDVTGLTLEEAISALKAKGFSYTLPDAGDADLSQVTVAEQMPRYNTLITANSNVVLYTKTDTEKKKVRVPDLLGYTLEEAYQTLTDMGLNMQANNIGTVVSQNIPKGTAVDMGSVIILELVNRDVESMG